MLRHQQLFNAMNQRIDSGIDMLDGYNASLESFNNAVDILGRLEAGDTTAVIDAQTYFGNESVTEMVSNEAIVYHVNSSQIQAVIDFVKKYLPILLRKLREYAKQFLNWLKVSSKRLRERLDGLSEKIKRSVQTEFVVSPGVRKTERYAAYLLSNKSAEFDFGTSRSLGSLVDASWAMNNVAERRTGEAATAAVHAYMKGVREWIGKGEHVTGMNATFPAASDYATAMSQLNNLVSPEQAFQALVDKHVGHDKLKSVTYTKAEIQAAQRKIHKAVDDLDQAVEESRKTIDRVRKDAENLEKQVNATGNQQAILWVKFSLLGLTKCENAVTAGFQKNVGVAATCIGLLERAVGNQVEAQ